MAYKVLITFLEEHDDYYLEDMFDTEEMPEEDYKKVQDAVSVVSGAAASGMDYETNVLDLMGECYIDPSLIDYEIEEI